MSGFLLIARNDIKRQFVQPFAWVVLALTCALLAWQFLVALDAYLRIVPKLANVPNSQGATDLIAIPLLRSLSGLLMLIVPLATMRSLAGERRNHSLPLLLAAGIGNLRIVLGTRRSPDGDRLRLVIRDDGVGMDVDAPYTGFGLLGMRERVLGLGDRVA